jgi:Zn-dependent M16 (insulinase) family peptidase
MKNELRSSFAPLGHNYASCRASRFASSSTQTTETWNGITQLEFAHCLAEMDTAETAAKLSRLREPIAARGRIANLTGSAAALKSGGALVAQRFNRLGSPKELSRRHKGHGDHGEIKNLKPPCPPCSPCLREMSSGTNFSEVFASPSLQIGFAAMTLRAAPFDTPAQTAETVLAHHLSTGALWEDIRMKGGAYGASASGDSLERSFSLSTYRDPAPLRSLDSFSAILKGSCSIEEDALVKTIIGCYSRETRPRSPAEKGITDFFRYLSRIEDGYRKRRLQRLIAASAGDIAAAQQELASQTAAGRVIITGMKDAEQAAKALGTEVQTLPV